MRRRPLLAPQTQSTVRSGETMLIVNGRNDTHSSVVTVTTGCQRYSLSGGGPLGPSLRPLFPMSGLGAHVVDEDGRVRA